MTIHFILPLIVIASIIGILCYIVNEANQRIRANHTKAEILSKIVSATDKLQNNLNIEIETDFKNYFK